MLREQSDQLTPAIARLEPSVSAAQIPAAKGGPIPLAGAPLRAFDFVASLESLRGLAALAVALFHSFHLLPVDGGRVFASTLRDLKSADALLMRLIMVPFNGGAAVSLFFVLSGFVLTLSLRRDARSALPKARSFVGRRFLRIYPALAINLALFVGVSASIAWWVPGFPITRFDTRQLLSNLLLLDTPVNGASWTLLVEILAIPLVLFGHAVTRRFGLAATLVLAGASVAILFSPRYAFYTLIGTYAFMFFFGMLVAEFGREGLIAVGAKAAKIGIILAIASMMSARLLLGYGSLWSLLVEAIASAVLVGVLAFGPRLAVHDVLEVRPLRSLGRISYSYYLYHPVALGLVVPCLGWLLSEAALAAHPFVGSTAIALISVGVTIPLAAASHMLVERPMIAIGRRL